MPIDDTTEVIAHFIGLFELNSESVRLRFEYNKWLAKLMPDPEFGALLNITVNVSAPYSLNDFNPGIRVPATDVDLSIAEAGFAMSFSPFLFGGPLMPLLAHFGTAVSAGVSTPTAGADSVFILPPPSSLATISLQSNVMSDQDIVATWNSGIDQLGSDAFMPALLGLASHAFSLTPLSVPDLPASEAAIAESGFGIVTAISDLRSPDTTISAEGEDVYMALGDDTYGLTVNGEAADIAPTLQSESKFFSDTQANATASATDEVSFHEVSTGGNLLINDAVITTNWLDAPVFVVLGDYVTGNAIVQRNSWNDVDTINGVVSDLQSATEGVNVSQTELLNVGAEPVAGTPGPSVVAMTTITGNLVNFNHIQQVNFGIDCDYASVEFSASETFIETGGNILYNMFDILALGFHYDLIVVGGNMTDVNFVTQTNVLLDADAVSFSGVFDGTVETSDNVLFNHTSINEFGVNTAEAVTTEYADAAQTIAGGSTNLDAGIQSNPDFIGDSVLSVLYVAGDFTDLQIIDQVNVLADPDQVGVTVGTQQATAGATVSVSTGANELINTATINDLGIDSTVYVGGETYSDALLYQAEFISEADPLMALAPTDLVSEAVLFLADGMLTEPAPDAGDGIETSAPSETPIDAMQLLVT
ncbi:hypothetical protein N4R57_08970 [Rhodobacteraceae bacterium D3-12]|nr:hypothetical protein N4R57_08970 [Rhodobacteraceae bacterium D3-12]